MVLSIARLLMPAIVAFFACTIASRAFGSIAQRETRIERKRILLSCSGLLLSLAVMLVAFQVGSTIVAIFDVFGYLSPLDRHLPIGVFRDLLIFIVLPGVVAQVGGVAFMGLNNRGEKRVRLTRIFAAGIGVIVHRPWAVLASVALVGALVLDGRVVFFDANVAVDREFIDARTEDAALTAPPIVDVDFGDEQSHIGVTLLAKKAGPALVVIDHVSNAKDCYQVAGQTKSDADLEPWGFSRTFDGTNATVAARVALQPAVPLTIRCTLANPVAHPTMSSRRVNVDAQWSQFVGSPSDADLQNFFGRAPSKQVVMQITGKYGDNATIAIPGAVDEQTLHRIIASKAWVRHTTVAFGQQDVEGGETLVIRDVQRPQVDETNGREFVALPPIHVIEWDDKLAQQAVETDLLLVGAIIALGLTLAIEAIRKSIVVLER